MTEELLNIIQRCLRISDINEAIPIINSCISARDRVIRGSSDLDFKLGNIVLDTRDGEIGFVIGPVDIFGKNTPSRGIISNFPDSPDDYFVIITKKVGEDLGRTFNFGVRYIKKKYLTPLGIDNNQKNDNNSLSDLDIFCNQQCIMECNSECKLYKYKKK